MGGDLLAAGVLVGRRQHGLELLQRHAQVTEPADDLGRGDLAGGVAPVPGARIGAGRLQQADLVVMPQRPARHVAGAREVADRQVTQHAAHCGP